MFSYYLTATWTLTFGHIKLTPDVALNVSFLDIVLGRYFRQEMGNKLPYADPAGTLDSWSGTQNEQKNAQNNVIEV